MAHLWFVSQEGRGESGPFPAEQLRRLVEAGELKPTDRVRQEGVERWAFARQVKGLFPASSGSAPSKVAGPMEPPPLPKTTDASGGSPSNPFAFDDSADEAPRTSKPKRKNTEPVDDGDSPEPSRSRARETPPVPITEPLDADEPPRKSSSKKPRDSETGDTEFGLEAMEESPRKARAEPQRSRDGGGNPFAFEDSSSTTAAPRRSRDESAESEQPRSRRRETEAEEDEPRRRRREPEDEERKPKPKSAGGFFSRIGTKVREANERTSSRGNDDDDDRDRRRERKDDDDEPPRRRNRDEDDESRGARRRQPELKERTASVLQKTGNYEEYDYAQCWNGIEEAGLNADELTLFCTTRTRHEKTVGSKLAGFFTGKKTIEPIYHLALFRSEAALLYASEEGNVRAIRFPLDGLNWQFLQGEEIPRGGLSKAADLFRTRSDEEIEDEERTVVLNLQATGGDCSLRLFRGSQTKALRQAFVKLVLSRAAALLEEGRYVLAERFLDKVPDEGELRSEAEILRKQMGIAGSVLVDYRQGHPELDSVERGLLRRDALGLEFFIESTQRSIRIRAGELRQIRRVSKGQYPPEYAGQIESQRKSAQAEIAVAKVASRSGNTVVKLAAAARIAAAKKRFRSAKFGAPFINRLALRVELPNARTTLVFDVAGTDRDATEQQAVAFYTLLKEVVSSAAIDESLPEAGSGVASPRLVGCPRCQAKLRAQQGGAVVQCPRCQAKVRVPQSEPGT